MSTLADFDTINDAAPPIGKTPEAFAVMPARWLSNGFYTVVFPDGSHRTFRVRLEQLGTFKGKRTVSLLIGPDNTSDYETLGFVESGGFILWKRHRGTRSEKHVNILWRLAKGETIEGHELHLSKRCMICNRPLTTPESNERGIGPECWQKVGAA